jgi:hypothetical protein
VNPGPVTVTVTPPNGPSIGPDRLTVPPTWPLAERSAIVCGADATPLSRRTVALVATKPSAVTEIE